MTRRSSPIETETIERVIEEDTHNDSSCVDDVDDAVIDAADGGCK